MDAEEWLVVDSYLDTKVESTQKEESDEEHGAVSALSFDNVTQQVIDFWSSENGVQKTLQDMQNVCKDIYETHYKVLRKHFIERTRNAADNSADTLNWARKEVQRFVLSISESIDLNEENSSDVRSDFSLISNSNEEAPAHN